MRCADTLGHIVVPLIGAYDEYIENRLYKILHPPLPTNKKKNSPEHCYAVLKKKKKRYYIVFQRWVLVYETTGTR